MAKPVITDKPILEQAEFNGTTIWRKVGGSIEVSDTGYVSVKSALKDIASKAAIDIEPEWNTQYLGMYIIRQLNCEKGEVISTNDKNTDNAILHKGNIENIRKILIQIKEARGESSLYESDKNAIATIFETIPDKYSYSSILIKLTVIDSMYSTQMGRRYYGLDELAKALLELHSRNNLEVKFALLAEGKLTKNDFKINDGKSNLFEECYGIGKDGTAKGTAVSLITKYAYFETKGHFPIFDSIAREMYPRIWMYCGFDKQECPNQKSLLELETFISAINRLKSLICVNNLTYDDIDRLLWTTGKIIRGNLSLVLSRDEYEFMSNKKLLGEDGFSVGESNLDQLTFLANKPLLKSLFELAKELS